MQYRINCAASHWRMRKLNEILPKLQEEFERQLNKGRLLELEAHSGTIVDELLEAVSSDSILSS